MAHTCTILYCILSTEHRDHNTPSTPNTKHFCTITTAALPVWRWSFTCFFSFKGFCETIQEVETHGIPETPTKKNVFFRNLYLFLLGVQTFLLEHEFSWSASGKHVFITFITWCLFLNMFRLSNAPLVHCVHCFFGCINPFKKNKLDHFPNFRGKKSKNIWNTT